MQPMIRRKSGAATVVLRSGMVLTITTALMAAGCAAGNAPARQAVPGSEGEVEGIARGTFTVRLGVLPAYDDAEGSMLGRMSLDKEWRGDIVGTSRGEMLTAITGVEGSAGYVALERVSGTLHGRSGTFVLRHIGTMARGGQQLAITVVPDSGTGDLAGLAGTLTLTIADGVHAYELRYTVAASAGAGAAGV